MRLNIATKINLFIGTLIVLPIISLGLFFINHITHILDQELSKWAGDLTENLATNCEYGVLTNNREELERLVHSEVKRREGIAFAQITDSSKKTLVLCGRTRQNHVRLFQAPITTSTNPRDEIGLTDINPPGENRKEIGTVTLGFSEQELISQKRSIRNLIVLILLVTITLLISGAYIGVGHLIRRPLIRLVRSIRIIGEGDLNHRADTRNDDELGQLAEAFNSMALNLSRLMVSKDYVDNILESMNEMLIVLDLNGIIQKINRNTSETLGYPPQALLGQPCKILFGPDPVCLAPAAQGIAPAEKVICSGSDTTIRTRSGQLLAINLSASRLFDDSGRVEGIICIAQDTTHIRESEKEKRELEQKLQLAEKMEALGRLAGGVAHDLNNTLGAILGYPDLLLRQEHLPHQVSFLQSIKKSGEKAANIVRDLLTLTRRGISVTEVLDLNGIVQEYLASPEHEKLRSEHPRVALSLNLSPTAMILKGSPIHLLKCIMNLIRNAYEAIAERGTVSVSTYPQTVRKAAEGFKLGISPGQYVCLRIQDDGSGITPEDIKRIFEPFFSKKEMGKSGTGLGMSVVWGTVKDHNGFIDVRSKSGEGTTFMLYFPLCTECPHPPHEPKPEQKLLGQGERILIVDDSEIQREMACHMLLNLRYQVDAVGDSPSALAYIRQYPVDLFILDMLLSEEIDGLDLFRKILEIQPNARALIASGYSETRRVREALSLGQGAYIGKPYTMETLARAIKKLLPTPATEQPPEDSKDKA